MMAGSHATFVCVLDINIAVNQSLEGSKKVSGSDNKSNESTTQQQGRFSQDFLSSILLLLYILARIPFVYNTRIEVYTKSIFKIKDRYVLLDSSK